MKLDNNVSNLPQFTGLYIALSGGSSEIICLQRKFGQWKEEDVSGTKERDLEFYEYVEAIRLTGDHLGPAGQVRITYRTEVTKKKEKRIKKESLL